ncbi:unnamed protein product [Lactuca saligna]|uniref:Uncharacterized protein n=1 Tax=Lactuca saligna TaxID=75948 RepID=A0AA35YMJ2_LACSI|nr:unnamed protein product [Lactuca saligna]
MIGLARCGRIAFTCMEQRKLMNKWGSILRLDDSLGEDMYKNRICILTTFQRIISEVVKVNGNEPYENEDVIPDNNSFDENIHGEGQFWKSDVIKQKRQLDPVVAAVRRKKNQNFLFVDKEQPTNSKLLSSPTASPVAALQATSATSAIVPITTGLQSPVVVLTVAAQKNVVVPVGFSGGFGWVLGVVDSGDNLLHPPRFSNFRGYEGYSEKSFTNGYFLNEIQKTLDIGKAMGYNLDECYECVKEIVEGNDDTRALRSFGVLTRW